MRRVGKILLIVGLLLLLALIVIGIIKFGSLIGFFLIYPWMTDLLSQVGLNPYVVKAIAIASTIFVWLVFFRMIFKWGSGKNIILGISERTWGIVVLVFFFIGYAVSMFFATRDMNFTNDGKALRFYTRNPITNEIQVFDHEGYDAFGQKAQAVNTEIAKELAVQEKYPNAEVDEHQIKNFFDRLSGKPLVFYYQDEQGTCHYYVQDGFSPATGDKLLPATEEARKKCDVDVRRAEEERKNFGEEKKKTEEVKKQTEEEKARLAKQAEDLKAQLEKLAELEDSLQKQQNVLTEEQKKLEEEKAKVKQDKDKGQKDIKAKQSALAAAQEQLEAEKQRAVRERRRLAKAREQLEAQAGSEMNLGTRPVTGIIQIKDGRQVEIHLNTNQDVGKK